MKKLTIFTAILLSIVCIMTSVYAAESFNITQKMEKSEFNKNEEIKVEFDLSSMQVGEGIISIRATLEYDKDSLTVISTEGQNGWKVSYNDAERIMLIEHDNLIKDNGPLFKVTFKIKENSKSNLIIGLKDITAAGAGDEISVVNVQKTITIKTEDNNGNGGNNPGDNNNGNNNNNNNNGSSNNGSNNNGGSSNNNGSNNNSNGSNSSNIGNNKPGSTTDGNKNNGVKIPQAGENNTVFFVLIGAATVSAIIFFVKAKMTSKSQK